MISRLVGIRERRRAELETVIVVRDSR